jgi:hypothetical protein
VSLAGILRGDCPAPSHPSRRVPRNWVFDEMRIAAGLLSWCLLVSACSSPSADLTRPTVRDSAGIRIVENPLEALGTAPQWRLSSTPTLQLGQLDGPDPYLFFDVTGAVWLQGLLWVLNRGTSELRAYRLDGTHALTTGRQGEGPGEFTNPLNLVVVAPDTLLIWDFRTHRISYLGADGTFLRSVSVLGNFTNPELVSAFDDGSFLFYDPSPFFPTTGGIEEAPIFLVRFAPDGRPADSLGVFPGGQMKKIDAPPGITFVAFSPVTRVAGGRKGFWVGVGEDLEIQERNPFGETIQIVRWEVPDRSVRQEHVDAFKSDRLGSTGSEEARERFRRMIEEAPVADRFPALDRLILDRVGRVWVRRFRRPTEDESDEWIIFDATGTLTARIHTPLDLQIHDIGEDYLLGETTGDFDEEYILLFEIVRSAADG